jgi:VanZ family protein
LINHNRTLVLEYWLPLLLWLAVIHFFSTDAFSGDQTSRFLQPLLRFFFPGLSSSEIEFWHGVIRKCGHVGEYFVLAVFAYRCLRYTDPNLSRARLQAGLFIVLAAMSDEVHQLMTVSRTGSLVDVGYDTVGGVSALWLTKLYEIRSLHPHSVL